MNKLSLKYGISGLRLKHLLALVDIPKKGDRVLDLGCATGYLGKIIKQKGYQVYGVDISSIALKQASKVLDKTYRIDLNSGSLPFPKNYFDIVICTELIEHLVCADHLLKQINKVLKKDGGLLISTPNFLFWKNRLDFLVGKFKYTEQGIFDKSHVHFFTSNHLIEVMRENGFSVTKRNDLVYPYSLRFLLQKIPSLFAYQFILKCRKKVYKNRL